MTRIALGIEYDGQHYHGWQSQQEVNSVQAEVERALSTVADYPVEVVCAGRTDAGVHALEQVVHFESDADRQIHAWLLGANSLLPRDIAVKWAKAVPEDFHARFSATRRRYRYIIYNHTSRPALQHKRVTWHTYPLNAELMHEAAQALVGEHDFSSFRAAECQANTPIRTLYELTIKREGDRVIMEVEGNAFLHHMVRNIAGVLMAIGAKKAPVAWMAEVLAAKSRASGGVTAPPDGLYFVKVTY
jgi:tRNA pseudouridine38-40 synthase